MTGIKLPTVNQVTLEILQLHFFKSKAGHPILNDNIHPNSRLKEVFQDQTLIILLEDSVNVN